MIGFPDKRIPLVALMLAFAGIAGPTECAAPAAAASAETTAADTSAPPPAASLRLVAQTPNAASGSSWYAVLILQATASAPAQAFDVDVTFTPGVAIQAVAAPARAGFNDDKALSSSGAPDLAAGQLGHIVDSARLRLAARGGRGGHTTALDDERAAAACGDPLAPLATPSRATRNPSRPS